MGDANAYFNVHWTFKKANFAKAAWSGRACQSVEEMLSSVQFAMKGADTQDIYLCMSSQRLAVEKVSARGHGYKAAQRNQSTVVHLRSLFIDLDVKDKAYATPADAFKALADFIAVTGLPRPTLAVMSGGGGLHVYWCLDIALTAAEWQPLANALAEATRRHGLIVDTACTVDSARILRIPGTFNKKYGTPRPVSLLTKSVQPLDIPLPAMVTALEPYMVAAPKDAFEGLTPRGKLAAVSDLSAGIADRQARPVKLDTVKEACGFIRTAIDTNGATYSYPLWHLSILMATFAEDGRAMAHEMSKGHEKYDWQTVEDMYEAKLRTKEERNMGWPKCQSVRDAGCTDCLTCPLFALGKSPLNMGKTAPTPFQPSEQTDLPPGYVRDDHRRIIRITADEKGETQQNLVSPYPMHSGWVQSSPWTLHFQTRVDHNQKDVHIAIPLIDINSEGMNKRFGAQGLGIKRKDAHNLQEFLVSWMSTLQKIRDKVVTSAPFGWAYDNGKLLGFAYGGTLWSDKEPRPSSAPDAVLARQYGPKGELIKWMEAAALITQQGRPDLDIFIACAFGAPLLSFTGHEGALLSAYSTESGIGKSTAMKVAQAVWGHPVEGVQSLDDTMNSVLHKIGATRNLPLFWDELKTEEDTTKFVNLTFKITGGKEKSRLHGDGSQRELGSWQTIIMAASNDSLLDHIIRKTKTTTAGIYRVLEFTVLPQSINAPKLAPGHVSRTIGNLTQNYGQAGLVYATHLGKNEPAIREMVGKMQDALNSKLSTNPDERFWIANVAACLCGATIANQLNLTSIDLKALSRFLIKAIEEMRKVVRVSPSDMRSGTSISAVMQQFFLAHRARYLLVVDRTPLGQKTKGRPPKGVVKIINPVDRIEGVVIQMSSGDKLMHISRNALREWLGKNGYSPTIVTQALIATWGARQMQGTLGAGTHLGGFPEPLLELDLNFGPASQFTDGVYNIDAGVIEG